MENHNQTVTWKVIDDKFAALSELVKTKFQAIERETALAYPNRDEFSKLIKELQEDIHALEMSEAKRQGSMAQSTASRAFILSVFATLAAIAAVIVVFAR